MKRFILVIISLALAMGCAVWFVQTSVDTDIKIRTYTIPSSKIKQDICIVLIADLHSYIYGGDNAVLADMIAAQNPDIIALAGDIGDDYTPIDGTELLLEKIVDIAPCYYVTGNHEHWADDFDDIMDVISSYNVHMLRNEYETITVRKDEIVLAGIDDPDSETAMTGEEIEYMFTDIAESPLLTVLLAHRPEYHDAYIDYGFDAVLSGHAHGGQVRIPFLLNGLFAPNQGWLPKYAGGIYSETNSTTGRQVHHIVSRGLVINPKLPRIFNPPELCVIRILAQ